MADIRLKCGSCAKILKVPAKFAGRVAACPACKKKLRVPEPAAAVAATPDESDEPAKPSPAESSAAIPEEPKVEKEAVAARASESTEVAGTDRRMGIIEWIVAVLLAPVGLILSLLWAIRRDKRWLPMLATSGIVTLLFAGVMYSQFDNLMEWYAWRGQEERITTDPSKFVPVEEAQLGGGGGGAAPQQGGSPDGSDRPARPGGAEDDGDTDGAPDQ